jgi:hypothetical protein
MMLQKDMGYSAASAGLMLVPFSIVSALTANLSSSCFKTFQLFSNGCFRMVIYAGRRVIVADFSVTGHPLAVVLLGAACISGIGMTFCFTALSVMGIQDVEP